MAFRIRFPIRCQALWIVLLGIATPCYSVVTICRSSGDASRSTGSGIPVTTVMRRMLASKISVEGARWGPSSALTVACVIGSARGAGGQVIEILGRNKVDFGVTGGSQVRHFTEFSSN